MDVNFKVPKDTTENSFLLIFADLYRHYEEIVSKVCGSNVSFAVEDSILTVSMYCNKSLFTVVYSLSVLLRILIYRDCIALESFGGVWRKFLVEFYEHHLRIGIEIDI